VKRGRTRRKELAVKETLGREKIQTPIKRGRTAEINEKDLYPILKVGLISGGGGGGGSGGGRKKELCLGRFLRLRRRKKGIKKVRRSRRQKKIKKRTILSRCHLHLDSSDSIEKLLKGEERKWGEGGEREEEFGGKAPLFSEVE